MINVNFCQSTKQSRSTAPSSWHIFPTIKRNSMSIPDSQQNTQVPSSVFPTINRNSNVNFWQSTKPSGSLYRLPYNQQKLKCKFLTVNKTASFHLPSSLQSTETQGKFLTVNKTVRFPLPYNQQKLNVNFWQSTKPSGSLYRLPYNQQKLNVNFWQSTKPSGSLYRLPYNQQKLNVNFWQSTKPSGSLYRTINRNSMSIYHLNKSLRKEILIRQTYNENFQSKHGRMTKWASSWDYGTYHIGDQRRLRWVCASAQSRLSHPCSHTWSMEVDEGSDQKSDI